LWREPSPTGAGADSAVLSADSSVVDPAGEERSLERAGFAIECSAGTYVRSLIADLGDAYCEQLRRTAIGPFDVSAAVAPPRRGAGGGPPPLISLDRALATLPK